MSSVVLTGDTSGSGTITVPAVAGTFTATIGSATGTHYPFTSGTAVASTSGTSIDFTSIPSWVKRITVMFSGVSTNGSSAVQVQLGTSSGATTSGYLGSGVAVAASSVASTSTAGFKLNGSSTGAGELINGLVTISLLNSATNTWSAFGGVGRSDAGQMYYCAGSVPLAAVLDRVRVTTVNGTDTFDAGSINILYE